MTLGAENMQAACCFDFFMSLTPILEGFGILLEFVIVRIEGRRQLQPPLLNLLLEFGADRSVSSGFLFAEIFYFRF